MVELSTLERFSTVENGKQNGKIKSGGTNGKDGQRQIHVQTSSVDDSPLPNPIRDTVADFRRASAMAILQSTASRYSTAWAESVEGSSADIAAHCCERKFL